jgi:hypothetical protein
MEDIDGPAATWGLLIIRVWRGSARSVFRLSVVAKDDVSAEEGEERHSFGSIDEALAFTRRWLESFPADGAEESGPGG